MCDAWEKYTSKFILVLLFSYSCLFGIELIPLSEDFMIDQYDKRQRSDSILVKSIRIRDRDSAKNELFYTDIY